MNEIKRIVVHHSASPLSTTRDDISRWHKERGFSDIGYHFVIEVLGQIRLGRRIPTTGAHVKGHNSNSIGICLVGDNTRRDQEWTSLQMTKLKELIKVLRVVWPGIPVVGHRDLTDTLCPGVNISNGTVL